MALFAREVGIRPNSWPNDWASRMPYFPWHGSRAIANSALFFVVPTFSSLLLSARFVLLTSSWCGLQWTRFALGC